MRIINKLVRYVGFLAMNLVFRWPIWILLYLAKPLKIIKFLFMVYPGRESDLDGYCPRRLAKSWVFSKKPVIGGLMLGGGLVLVVPNTVEEFERDFDTSDRVVERLVWISKLINAKAIALAGRLPGIISRKKGHLEKPIVRGNRGTVFCVMETLYRVINEHKIDADKVEVSVVGIGYVGRMLIDNLKEEGFNVIGIDIEGTEFYSNRERIKTSDIVIVLTPRGDDFSPYIEELKEGAIVIDDTHPKIIERPEKNPFYKVAIGREGVKFIPRLPGYKPDWIPGCVIEAMVAAETGYFNHLSQQEFNRMARELGFFALMVQETKIK